MRLWFIGNLGVLPYSILVYAVPLSILEVSLAGSSGRWDFDQKVKPNLFKPRRISGSFMVNSQSKPDR